MSILYLLIVLGVWAVLTWVLWKGWRRWRVATGGKRRLRNAVVLVIGVVWFGASFWYAGGQKLYYDMQVKRLCAIDGGIRVYETVKLPEDKFNQWKQPNFYRPTQGENALGPEYVFKEERHYHRRDNPMMIRHHYRVLRRSDGKVLGETISYGRGGGDMPGPWHPSSFTCPEVAEAGPNALLKAIFVQVNKGD